jgi:hypothetical protein
MSYRSVDSFRAGPGWNCKSACSQTDFSGFFPLNFKGIPPATIITLELKLTLNPHATFLEISVISGFCRKVDEKCALLCY